MARLSSSHLSKLQNGRLFHSGIPPQLLLDNRVGQGLGLVELLMDSHVTWYRASNLFDPLAVFEVGLRGETGARVTYGLGLQHWSSSRAGFSWTVGWDKG